MLERKSPWLKPRDQPYKEIIMSREKVSLFAPRSVEGRISDFPSCSSLVICRPRV